MSPIVPLLVLMFLTGLLLLSARFFGPTRSCDFDQTLWTMVSEADRSAAFAPFVLSLLFGIVPLLAVINMVLGGSARLAILIGLALAGLIALNFLAEIRWGRFLAHIGAGLVSLFFMAILPVYVWRSLTEHGMHSSSLNLALMAPPMVVLLALAGYGVLVLGRLSRIQADGAFGLRSGRVLVRLVAIIPIIQLVLSLAPFGAVVPVVKDSGLHWHTLLLTFLVGGFGFAAGWPAVQSALISDRWWSALFRSLGIGFLLAGLQMGLFVLFRTGDSPAVSQVWFLFAAFLNSWIVLVIGLQNILPCSPKKRNSLLGGILIVLALLGAAMVRLT